jgi:beta-lactamase class A
MRRQQDKCKLPLHLPEFVAVAHKTGELDGAEHDAGVVYGARFPYAIAVMADNLSDAAQGRETIANISRTVYDFLHKMD